jgi:hypothetical protein
MERWMKTALMALAMLAIGVIMGCEFGNGSDKSRSFPPDSPADRGICGVRDKECCRGKVCDRGLTCHWFWKTCKPE